MEEIFSYGNSTVKDGIICKHGRSIVSHFHDERKAKVEHIFLSWIFSERGSEEAFVNMRNRQDC